MDAPIIGSTTNTCSAPKTPSFAALPCTSIPETNSAALIAVMIQFANDATIITSAMRRLPISP